MSVPFSADLALASAAARGDMAAVDVLGQRMRCIGRFVAGLCGRYRGVLSRHDQEDLTQDVAGTVWSRLGDYSGLAPLESWVYRFCDFAFRNAVRRKRRLPVAEELIDMPTSDSALLPDEDLQRCLDRLSSDDRQLLDAKHVAGQTLDEIATHTGAKLNTVKSRYHRALLQLRACLKRGDVQ